MKSLNLLLSLTLCLAFLVSCSEEEDKIDPNASLIGSWNLIDMQGDGTSSVEYNGQESTSEFTVTGKDLALSTEFTEEPNNYTSSGSYTAMMKVSANGQTQETEIPMMPFILGGTWEQDGDKLIITTAGQETQEATIVELSEKVLKLKYDYEYDMSAGGMSTVYSIKGTYEFERK